MHVCLGVCEHCMSLWRLHLDARLILLIAFIMHADLFVSAQLACVWWDLWRGEGVGTSMVRWGDG